MSTTVSWKRAAVLALGALILPGGFLMALAALLASWAGPSWLTPSAPRGDEAPWTNGTPT